MMIYGETPTQWKNHVVTKIKDNKKIKSKLFNIEQMVKKSSPEIIFPMIEKVYQSE